MAKGVAAHHVGGARTGQLDVHDALHLARPIGHHDDAVGQLHRLGEIVRDQQGRLVERLLDLRDLVAQQQARLLVECREGLIHQQNLGLRDERARDRNALAHAARQLRGKTLLERGEADHVDEMVCPVHALGFRDALQFERKGDIVDDIAPRKGRFLLEHHADGGMGRRNALVADHHRALVIAEQTADDVEKGGLAAARRANHRDEFALRDIERNMIHRRDDLLIATESFDDVVDHHRRLKANVFHDCAQRNVSRPACAGPRGHEPPCIFQLVEH